MGTVLIFLLLCVTQAHGVLQWSASSPADGASVPVCEGQEVVLDWNFTLGPQEHLEDIRWFVSSNTSEEMVAAFSADNFLVTQTFSGRVRHLGNAAIAVNNVTMEDLGLYSVDVHVSNASGKCVIRVRRSVSLNVAASLKLQVRQSRRAVYNNDTGEHHVKLECGQFGDLDQPFVDVIWKTPSGSSLPSSNYDNGYFELLLDNPVLGGNYSCRLNPTSQAALCFHDDDPTTQKVTVTVDELKARLTLMEAQQITMQTELKAENADLRQLVEQNQLLVDQYHRENANLTEQLRRVQADRSHFQDTTSSRVSFFARLSRDQKISYPDPVILTNIYSNDGSAYSTITGRFTAPLNGTFVFSVSTGAASSSAPANVYLMKENEWVCVAHSYYSGNMQGSSCQVVLHLLQEQTVWLKASGSSHYTRYMTLFSGFLLHADD